MTSPSHGSCAILDVDFTFVELREELTGLGWNEVQLAGLLAPLMPGEPEHARFEKGAETLLYSFNPAVRLRIVEGDVPTQLATVSRADVAVSLSATDPEVVLRSILTVARLGWTDIVGEARSAVERLPDELARVGRTALRHLSEGPAAPAHVGVGSSAVARQRELLRSASADRSDQLAPIIEAGLEAADVELRLTAMIAAARLDLRSLARNVARANVEAAGARRRERALYAAIRALCVDTLCGAVPGAGPPAKDRLWYSILDRVDQLDEVDDGVLLVFALMGPELPADEPCHADYRNVRRVEHFLGHGERAVPPHPIRRWVPPAPFCIAIRPLPEAVPPALIANQLAGEQSHPDSRLPSADEWEAALRGPNGRTRPWGITRRPGDGSTVSPWGVELGPMGAGEWARDDQGDLVVVGSDRTGHVAHRRIPGPDTIALVRPVITCR